MSTEEKTHYESLITFLKYTITLTGACLTLIISAGIYFTYSSTKEMKQEIRNELKDTKEDFNNNIKQARNEIELLNNHAFSNIKDIRYQADNAINYVKQDAKNIAINTSIEKVNETFQENNIQELINKTTEKEIEYRINQMIQDQIQKSNEKLVEMLNIMPNFMLAVDKFRAGDRKAFEYLDSIRINSQDSLKIQIAEKIIQEKILDYNNYYGKYSKERLLGKLSIDKEIQDTTCQILSPKLKYIILNDNNLSNVYYATVLLSKCIGREIAIFDFNEVKKIK